MFFMEEINKAKQGVADNYTERCEMRCRSTSITLYCIIILHTQMDDTTDPTNKMSQIVGGYNSTTISEHLN